MEHRICCIFYFWRNLQNYVEAITEALDQRIKLPVPLKRNFFLLRQKN